MILLAACTLLAGPLRAAAPPTVGVEVRFAPNLALTADYTEEEVAACRAAVAERLALLGRRTFSYLNWNVATGGVAAGGVTANLILQIEEERRRFGEVVRLRYSGTIENAATTLPGLVVHELYSETNLAKPTHDPKRLAEDMNAVLLAQFNNTRFCGDLQEQLLALVPLTATVELDPALRCIVLPISAGALRASKSSVLLVQYLTHLPPAGPRKAFVRLNPREPDADQWERPAGCVVIAFECLPDRTTDWAPVIVDSFERRDAASVRVFMADYKKNYAADMARGAVETSPR